MRPVELERRLQDCLDALGPVCPCRAAPRPHAPRLRVLRTLLTLIVATVVASCGEDTPTSSSSLQASPAGAAEASPEAVAPLVGRWEQTHHCEDLVRAFDAAGLAAVASSCEGKHPQLHFHFFTEAGLFGSLDKNEQQVDDGMYEIIDAHTFTIGDSTFRYTVTGATRLRSNPSSHAHSARRPSHRRRISPPDPGWSASRTKERRGSGCPVRAGAERSEAEVGLTHARRAADRLRGGSGPPGGAGRDGAGGQH
jgi:hypothetical protein